MPERKPVALNINEGFYHFCFQVDDVDAHQFIGERMGGYIENRQAVGKWESRVSVA